MSDYLTTNTYKYMIVITNIERSKYQFLKAKVSIRSTKHGRNASKVFDVSFKEGTFDKPSIGKIADWITSYAKDMGEDVESVFNSLFFI